jgi:hypothetical protein
MSEQIDIFGNAVKIKPKIDKEKRNWENRFQRWSDKQMHEGINSYGACGYGSMCDYCKDMGYGRPCVRALNEMCRTEGIKLDYSKDNFVEVWNGEFERKETD